MCEDRPVCPGPVMRFFAFLRAADQAPCASAALSAAALEAAEAISGLPSGSAMSEVGEAFASLALNGGKSAAVRFVLNAEWLARVERRDGIVITWPDSLAKAVSLARSMIDRGQSPCGRCQLRIDSLPSLGH